MAIFQAHDGHGGCRTVHSSYSDFRYIKDFGVPEYTPGTEPLYEFNAVVYQLFISAFFEDLPMHLSRRELLPQLAFAAGAAAVLPAFELSGRPPRLDVKDPAAVAAGYVENASQADAKKYSNYVKGSSCGNCAQLQGAAGAPYRPCIVFRQAGVGRRLVQRLRRRYRRRGPALRWPENR